MRLRGVMNVADQIFSSIELRNRAAENHHVGVIS